MHQDVMNALTEASCDGGFHIVAIDGGSASGKTSLAAEIAESFECNVFHMDDFFLRPEQRTEERYAEAGGNVDRERFEEEVLMPLTEGRDVEYRKFSCKTFSLGEPENISFRKLNIVEGVYSTHPTLAAYYDIKIYLDISDREQRKRLTERNGKDGAAVFFERWIPLERTAFEWYKPCEHADIVVRTGEEK